MTYKICFGKVGAVSFLDTIAEAAVTSNIPYEQISQLHKHHYYNKNAVNLTWVVDSEYHKGRRSVVIYDGGKLQSSVIE